MRQQGPLLGCEISAYDRTACDLSAPPAVIEKFVESLATDGVIIAAAYTQVDDAESEYDLAQRVNAAAPGAVAKACARRNLPLVHISTDYVFSGEAKTPYKPSHDIDPINAYGRSKYEGEQAVMKAHDKAAILRTSWVFDGTGKNFMTTMLRLAQSRRELRVVSDQIGRPTYAGHLARASLQTLKALRGGDVAARGIFHATGTGDPISWADFARAIFERAAADLPHVIEVTPIPSSAYPTPAKRPAYSVLETSKFDNAVEALPDWKTGLEQAYAEWTQAH